jgi:hypothetical protein
MHRMHDHFRYAMMNRHGLAMSGWRPGPFGRSATVDLAENSSNNPTQRREASSNSSSNANYSAAVIDLVSDDIVLTLQAAEIYPCRSAAHLRADGRRAQ